MMRLGLHVGYAGSRASVDLELVREAAHLGFHSVWVSEAYGSDAVSMAAWIAAQTETIHVGTAVLQIPARTPAMTAMTATTLDQLSGGRFLLGLGPSGPQVVEGWHGVPYGDPIARTREYVEIIRTIWARAEPLQYQGAHYQIPYRGPGASGLGKPLRSIAHGRAIPVYLGAIGPKSVAQTAEIADGWLPVFCSPARLDLFRPAIEAGFRKAGAVGGRAGFDIAPSVVVVQGDDLRRCLERVKPVVALYVGGMGARRKNFYNDLARRYGYEDAARRIQELYLAGRTSEAAAAVPDALADEVSVCGPPARMAERLAAWKEAGVTTLICATTQVEALRTLAAALAGC